jgi:hypothetical protein
LNTDTQKCKKRQRTPGTPCGTPRNGEKLKVKTPNPGNLVRSMSNLSVESDSISSVRRSDREQRKIQSSFFHPDNHKKKLFNENTISEALPGREPKKKTTPMKKAAPMKKTTPKKKEWDSL